VPKASMSNSRTPSLHSFAFSLQGQRRTAAIGRWIYPSTRTRSATRLRERTSTIELLRFRVRSRRQVRGMVRAFRKTEARIFDRFSASQALALTARSWESPGDARSPAGSVKSRRYADVFGESELGDLLFGDGFRPSSILQIVVNLWGTGPKMKGEIEHMNSRKARASSRYLFANQFDEHRRLPRRKSAGGTKSLKGAIQRVQLGVVVIRVARSVYTALGWSAFRRTYAMIVATPMSPSFHRPRQSPNVLSPSKCGRSSRDFGSHA